MGNNKRVTKISRYNSKEFKQGRSLFFSSALIFFIICSGMIFALSPTNNITKGAPVVDIDQNQGSWNDTFDDQTGIDDKTGLNVDTVIGDVSIVATTGYNNNFDSDPDGEPSGWIYTYSSNSMLHHIGDDPYESGKCLKLWRNDNGGSFASHELYKEFNTKDYNVISFDLTPWSMIGSGNRQGYLYVKYYNSGSTLIHEARYYWDDSRGIPQTSASLTPVDLGWAYGTGQPGTMGDNRFYLYENISADIDVNTFANLNSIMANTAKVRYGFYQDGGGGTAADQVMIDNLKIFTGYNQGELTSTEIAPLNVGQWDSLEIAKTENPPADYITVTILDSQTEIPIVSFKDLAGSSIDISSLDALLFPSIKLKAGFLGKSPLPILHSWEVSWKINTPPVVDSLGCSVNATGSIYRTEPLTVFAECSDDFTSHANLLATFQYKSPLDTDWQTDYLTSPEFVTARWDIIFAPPVSADLGLYDFRVKFQDTFGMESTWSYLNDSVTVLNNIPTALDISISPKSPKTTDDIVATITATSSDVESEPITYNYWWYKNDVLQYSLILNSSKSLTNTIPGSTTKKHEIWRCVVTPNDGHDNGPSGSAEVTVSNTAPAQVAQFKDIEMNEDSVLVIEDKLISVFDDIDGDTLEFFAEGQKNISVELIQENGTLKFTPEENWFGIEYISFYANDSELSSPEVIVKVSVIPVNDLPRIISVGSQHTTSDYQEMEFIVNQDDWLNITVEVEDIDSDVKKGKITFILNITERADLFFIDAEKELCFHPGNLDVGWHYIDIKITDNNETPIQYISQPIRIHVINVNDPPSVDITEPEDGLVILETEKTSLSCTAEDIDFLIPESTEKLTYRWYTTTPEVLELGTTPDLVNITLKPGNYTIFVEVSDSASATAKDSINILVEKVEDDTDIPFYSDAFSIALLVIIIIIIIILVVFFFIIAKKRKKKAEVMEAHPEVISRPAVMGAPAATAQRPIGEAVTVQAVSPSIPTPVIQSQPTPSAQLPTAAAPPTVRTYSMHEEQKAGIDTKLSAAEKLELLDERLLKGEIDQNLYNILKAKFERQAGLVSLAAQLPPAREQN
jgi:hypothetical protein